MFLAKRKHARSTPAGDWLGAAEVTAAEATSSHSCLATCGVLRLCTALQLCNLLNAFLHVFA